MLWMVQMLFQSSDQQRKSIASDFDIQYEVAVPGTIPVECRPILTGSAVKNTVNCA